MKEGKYTIETFAKESNITRQSALNKLTKLKKLGLASVSGGGKQKRIYTISNLPKKRTNGFYDLVNRYSPEKLQPRFAHYVTGKYTAERAIIDGIRIEDARTMQATSHLFRHVEDWKLLFRLARKHNLEKAVIKLYKKASKTTKTKRMPKRYMK